MDPLSILAGVVSLTAVAAQTIKLAHDFTRDARGSKQQASTMIESLEFLQGVLSSLNDRLQGSKGPRPTVRNSVLESTVRSCRGRVEGVQAELQKALKGSRFRIAMRWPLSKKDHEESIRDISVFAQWIQMALTVDNGALLSRTLEQVNDLSITHARSADMLEDIGGMFLNLTLIVK